MNTLDFFRQVLPSDGYYCAATPRPDGKGFKQRFFSDLGDLADFVTLLSQQGVDAYYGVSSFKTSNNRKGENAYLTKLLALDLDVGKVDNSYPTRKAAMTAFQEYLSKVNLPRPTIVSSGAGFHVYWPLTRALTPEQWLPLARALKQSAIDNGLIIDPAPTADLARVLRPVGTVHVKSGREVSVLMEGDLTDPDAIMAKVGFIRQPRKTNLLNALAVKREEPPAIAGIVVNKCQQINWAVHNPTEVSEPMWYSLMGVAAYTTNPEETAVAWSERHPGFSERETLRKLEQWRANTTGPATCSRFEAARPGGCKGCTFSGKVVTPVRLGAQFEEVSASDSAPDPVINQQVPVPAPFKRTSHGIKIVVDDTDIDVCPFDIYPVGYGRDETLGYEVVRFHWDRRHVGWVELKLRQALLTEGHRDFATAIADQGIMLYGKRQTELFQMLLRNYLENLKAQRGLTNLYATMGWKAGFSEFVMGDTIIRKEAGQVVEDRATLASGISRVGSDLYGASGTLESWRDATAILDQASMPWHAFALGMGFSAPLFAFTGLKGMTVSLYGPTGGGKSLVQYWIQSIYGDPDKLHFSAKYTQNSLFSRLGMYCNLPMTIDEATMMPDKDVGDFLYWVSQGRDKARLSRSAEERDAKTWALPVVLSTNKSVHAKLMASGLDTDAQMARLLEISIPQHKLFRKDSTAGSQIYNHLMANYGTAGREYIKELIRLGEPGIRRLIEDGKREFKERYGAQFSGQERFWEQAIVLQDIGSQLAAKLGLIAYDHTRGTRWVLEQLGAIRTSVSENNVNSFDMLGEFLNDMASSAVTVLQTGKQPPFVDYSRLPRADIRVRFELYRPTPSAKFERGVLYIDRAEFRKWIAARGGDYKAFLDEMNKERAVCVQPSKRIYMGKDTPTKLGQSYVIGFDLAHEKLSGILNDAEEATAQAAESKLKLVTGD